MEVPTAQVINLDKRPDKMQMFSHAFKNIPFQVTRFPGIADASGWIGCAKSHMAVARLAKEKKLPWVMVFEDDCLPSKDFESRLLQLLPVLKKHTKDWDLFLGGPTQVEQPIVRVQQTPALQRIGSAFALHFYILNSSAQDLALNWTPDEGPIDVQQARKMRLVCTQPHMAVQQPSVSDIQGKVAHQGREFSDSDETLLKSEYRMKQIQQAVGVAVVAFFGILQLSTQT